MRYGIVALVLVFGSVGSAQAHKRYQHPMVRAIGHGLVHMLKSMHRRDGLYICAGCVVRQTMAGAVAVSTKNADRLVGAINALYEAGFRGPVNCAAAGGHVSHSLHYSGNACDMAQTGWGRTPARIMYHASAILARFGVRDGCSFGDCGHIDTGQSLRHYAAASHRERHRYATRRHHVRTQVASTFESWWPQGTH